MIENGSLGVKSLYIQRSLSQEVSRQLLLVMLCVALTACGGGSSGSTGGEQGSNASNGAEPRFHLALTAPAQTQLNVTTASEQRVLQGGETNTQSITSSMLLDVSLEQAGDGFRIEVIPELLSVSPEELQLSGIELPRMSDNLNALGERTAVRDSRTIVDVLALDTFSVAALSLSYPGTAVGVGASWTNHNDLPLINSSTVTTVDEINSSAISVTQVIDTGSDPEQRYSINGNMTAVYALPSLLMTSADISLSVRFEDELYINGVLQTLIDTTTFSQTIREVAE